MFFDKISDFRKYVFKRGAMYFAIGKDIYDYGKEAIKNKLEEERHPKKPVQESRSQVEVNTEDLKRKNLERNLSIPNPNDPITRSKQESLLHSQGVSDHTGTSYHGPGKVGEATNSNMAHRNYDNHQGN